MKTVWSYSDHDGSRALMVIEEEIGKRRSYGPHAILSHNDFQSLTDNERAAVEKVALLTVKKAKESIE